jgi:mevalonate kinase
LFGEHAVVYGQPAIAAPVKQVEARAEIEETTGGGLTIYAQDLDMSLSLRHAAKNGTARMAQLVLETCGKAEPNARITLHSTIPIAGGLGSGAAVSAALGRALSEHLGCRLSAATLSELVYETEKIYHGTPSGIDNTVICYGQPVYFVRDVTITPFTIGQPFTLLIADTGVPSPTHEAVGDVRKAWQADPDTYNRIFESIGELADQARLVMERGEIDALPMLMNRNHALLQQMGVSSPMLDHYIDIALQTGATGAKLSGGGRGGNIIVMADVDKLDGVQEGLEAAGITHIIRTEIA